MHIAARLKLIEDGIAEILGGDEALAVFIGEKLLETNAILTGALARHDNISRAEIRPVQVERLAS